MEKEIIRITKRIDLNMKSDWPKASDLLDTTFNVIIKEMGMQRSSDWRGFVASNPKLANQITHEVGLTLKGYLGIGYWPFSYGTTDIILNVNLMYDIDNFFIKIQECNFNERTSLNISLYCTTEELTYLGAVGEMIICAIDDKSAELKSGAEIETFMLKVDETLMISRYRAIN